MKKLLIGLILLFAGSEFKSSYAGLRSGDCGDCTQHSSCISQICGSTHSGRGMCVSDEHDYSYCLKFRKDTAEPTVAPAPPVAPPATPVATPVVAPAPSIVTPVATAVRTVATGIKECSKCIKDSDCTPGLKCVDFGGGKHCEQKVGSSRCSGKY